jgi:hypothetical protein
VVPGLADIDVRVLTNGVRRVTVLPVHWRAGLEGAPPPDVATPVEGEPGLYHAGPSRCDRSASLSVGTHNPTEPAQQLTSSSLPANAPELWPRLKERILTRGPWFGSFDVPTMLPWD